MRGLALLLFLPSVARAADLPARLSVEQGPGAEECAGREQLEARVEGILHRPLAAGSAEVGLSIDVRFERATGGAFVARVSASGPKPGQRVLRDSSPTCDALGEAVAVTLALLLDSAQSEAAKADPAEQPPAPKKVEAPAPEPPAPEAAASAREPSAWSLRASLVAGGGYGLAGTGTLLGSGHLGARYGKWTFDLGASSSWPTSHDFEAGGVSTSLLFGSLRGCYLHGHSFALGPCLQLGLGRLRGDGSGYEQAQTISLPWLAVGMGLAAEAPLSSRLYVSLGATLWVPSERHTFSVQNAGIAWESKRVAGVVTAGLGLALF